MTGEVWAVIFHPKILHAPEQQILPVHLSAARPHSWRWGCSIMECSRQTRPVETMGERQMINLDKEHLNKVIFDCDTCSQGNKYGDTVIEG